MPVRSLSSPILRWPDDQEVVSALVHWASEVERMDKNICMIGYFGSYARGDWGVGSDLDVIVVVESSKLPFERRGIEWDTTSLPVPVDLLVYTRQEWRSLAQQGRFAGSSHKEVTWILERSAESST